MHLPGIVSAHQRGGRKRCWNPNLSRIELEIWTGCNLACPNCDRSAAQAPAQEGMSVEQVKRFVEESIKSRWQWDRISLLGGEPTLHPNFDQVVAAIKPYHEKSPKTKIQLFTNGFGRKVRRVVSRVPPWLTILNSEKNREAPLFSPCNLAPIDCDFISPGRFRRMCAIASYCGLGLTRYGYYPCGAGGSIDRIFGLDIGLKRLRDVTKTTIIESGLRLCALCGHFRLFDGALVDHDQRISDAPLGWVQVTVLSPTWITAYERYQRHKPRLSPC